MGTNAKILAFAGSVRKESFNKKLIRIAVEGARKAGAEVTLIDLKDYPLPLMDEDLEAEIGVPTSARKLKDIFAEHDGLLIAAPEYNSSITPLLKNTFDWISRLEPGVPSLHYIAGKYAAIMSASPSALGGIRGLVTLRMLLGNIKVTVLPEQVTIRNAEDAFYENGNLKDAKQTASVEKLGAKLAELLARLNIR